MSRKRIMVVTVGVMLSLFMLASTATVPLYGKLSDLFGRRRLEVHADVF